MLKGVQVIRMSHLVNAEVKRRADLISSLTIELILSRVKYSSFMSETSTLDTSTHVEVAIM